MAWAWHRLQAMRHARQKRRGSSGLGTMMGTLPFQCTYRIETGGDRTRWFWDGSPPRDRSACDPMLGAAELRVYLARLPACSPFCVLQEYHVWRGCFGAFLGLGSGQMEVDVALSLPSSMFFGLKLPDCLPALGSIALWSCLCSGGRQFPACRREAHPSPAAEHFLPAIDRIRLGTRFGLASLPPTAACLSACRQTQGAPPDRDCCNSSNPVIPVQQGSPSETRERAGPFFKRFKQITLYNRSRRCLVAVLSTAPVDERAAST